METVILDDLEHNIRNKLNDIFKRRFEIDLEIMKIEWTDEHLLGNKIRLVPRELLYLYHDIENIFNIKISQEFIASGGFSTINSICNYIKNQLDKRI